MFYQADQIYPVQEDTLLLKKAILEEIKLNDNVLEIGTGNAEVALSIVGKVRSLIVTDINPHAVIHAKKHGLDAIRADLTAPFKCCFSLIVFNLPYLPTDKNERIDDWLEFALDGGPDGRRVFYRFLPSLSRVLALGGRLLLLISSLTGLEEVLNALFKEGYSVEVLLSEKLPGEELYVIRGVYDKKKSVK